MCFEGDFSARRDGEKVSGKANPGRFWEVSDWQVFFGFLKISAKKLSFHFIRTT